MNTAQSLPPLEVGTAAHRVLTQLGVEGRLDLEIVESERYLPRAIREHAMEAGVSGGVSAVYYDNRIYVVSDQMTSEEDVERAVLYQGMGHAALREYMSAMLRPLVGRLYLRLGGDEGVQQMAADMGIQLDAGIQGLDETDRRLYITEELLAKAQAQKSAPSRSIREKLDDAVKTMVGGIRDGLRQMGILNMQVNTADMMFLLKRIRQGFFAGKKHDEMPPPSFLRKGRLRRKEGRQRYVGLFDHKETSSKQRP